MHRGHASMLLAIRQLKDQRFPIAALALEDTLQWLDDRGVFDPGFVAVHLLDPDYQRLLKVCGTNRKVEEVFLAGLAEAEDEDATVEHAEPATIAVED